MLQHYYDVRDKEHFEEWYNGLYIGKHPTPERNSCLIISLDFAVVNAEPSNYRQSLDAHRSTEFNELTGFNEKEVRAMLTYYATTCEFHHTVDELAVCQEVE